MGADSSSQNGPQPVQLAADPCFPHLQHYRISPDLLLLGHELELPDQTSSLSVQRQLQLRQKMSLKYAQKWCLLPICNYHFMTLESMCSQQERCIVMCRKPHSTLASVLQARKNNGGFSSGEISHIVDRVCLAVRQLASMVATIPAILLKNVLMAEDVYLCDPLISGLGEHGWPSGYGSPEGRREGQQTGLYGAGILGLQLCYPQAALRQQVYQGHQYSSGSTVNTELVMQLVCGVVDIRLRNRLAILTSTHIATRKNIYQIIEQEMPLPQPRQKVRLMHSPTMNRSNSTSLQNSQVASKIQQEQTSGLKPRQCNQSYSPNEKNHKVIKSPSSSVTRSHQSHSEDKQNIQVNVFEVKSAHHPPETPTRRNFPKKNQFSTIKEVTEYDSEEKGSQWGEASLKMKSSLKKAQLSLSSNRSANIGKLFYQNGKLAYEGQWLHNEFHGQGKVFNDQPVSLDKPFDYQNFRKLGEEWVSYEGELSHDQKEGWGSLWLSNGEHYEGQFLNDAVHGEGTYYPLNQSPVKGVWRESVMVRRKTK